MSTPSSTTAFDEYLNEQLINCFNVQTNVIQNLAQYSQHISLQLIEIKNNVDLLANRIVNLQQQQSLDQIRPQPFNALLPFPPSWQLSPAPFSFVTSANELPSRAAPFVFGSLSSSHAHHPDQNDEPWSGPLLPVEVPTGDEDENLLFCERAKLYRFDPSNGQMREQAVVELKILQDHTTNLCRLLMDEEQALTVYAHHLITADLDLKLHPGMTHTYLWSAIDFADGDANPEVFCVKFETDEKAQRFARIFHESKENTPDLPLIGRISLGDDDVIPLGQLQPTVEQIERARKLQLPPTFFLYENKAPCKGCRGCPDDPPSNEIQSSNRTKSLDHSPPKDCRTIIKAKRSLPSNRPPPPSVPAYEQPSPQINPNDDVRAAQANQKKSRNFSAHHLAGNSLDNYATQMAENVLNGAKQELRRAQFDLDKQKSIVTTEDDNSKSSSSSHSGFSFTNLGTTIDFQFSPKSPFKFGSTPKLSFSDLVKQPCPSSNSVEERVFPGQGSLIFGADTTEDDYEPSFSFKPIVTLFPVEVKTGEEDENILFCERAKLYRFDAPTKQMKERGIGEMKILQHKTTHRCRVLMRREQVLKVCANHRITDQLELKPHQEKAHAFIWSATDFADGQAKDETLCVKFKTSDMAERFFQQFNAVKNVT